MLVAAAVCPHPPILIPEVGRGEPVAARAAAVDAVRRLVASQPDRIILVGDAPRTEEFGPGATGTMAGFGVDLTVPLGPAPASAPRSAPCGLGTSGATGTLPLSLTVGAWLLHAAGWTGARSALGVAAASSPAQAGGLGERLVASAGAGERLGLLVMGDGSARRTLKAPGSLDDRAGPFDAAASAALGGPDPAGLLALDPTLAAELLVAGRACWQVLAGALLAAAAPQSGLPAGTWRSELLYDDAPYGVGYLVAVCTPQEARSNLAAG